MIANVITFWRFSFMNIVVMSIAFRTFLFKFCFLKKIAWLYRWRSSSWFFEKFSDRRVKLSDFVFCNFDRYVILKLNSIKNFVHFVCFRFNCFEIMKCSKFLWFVKIFMSDFTNVFAHFERHFSNVRTIINSFLSYIS